MKYRLIITNTGWRILLRGREVMGGSLDSVRDARRACRELNREGK